MFRALIADKVIEFECGIGEGVSNKNFVVFEECL